MTRRRIAENLDWMFDAACRGHDVRLWFPHDRDTGATARAICNRCDVRINCLAYAQRHHITDGIWGGRPEPQHRRKKKREAA